MTRFLIQVLLLLLVTAFAWRRGGKPERHVSAIYLGMFVLSTGYAITIGEWATYRTIPYYKFALDAVALLLVVHVALRANRWWVLWVGSAQFLAVTAHFLRIAGLPLPPIVYAAMERWPVWLAIVLTGFGTWQHIRRSAPTADVT